MNVCESVCVRNWMYLPVYPAVYVTMRFFQQVTCEQVYLVNWWTVFISVLVCVFLCVSVCLCVFCVFCVYFCVSADIFVKRMMTRSTWLIGGLCPHPAPISGHSGQSIKQCNRPSDAGPGNHAGFSFLKNYLSATEPSLFVPPVTVGRLFNSCSYQTWSATPVIHENTTEGLSKSTIRLYCALCIVYLFFLLWGWDLMNGISN